MKQVRMQEEIKMKKILSTRSITAISLLLISIESHAVLLPTSNLGINPGITSITGGQPTNGSWFALEMGGPGIWSYVTIEGKNGINLGVSQLSDGIPGGNIDMPWEFFGEWGAHQTSSPIAVLSDDGTGHVTLDFSGWNYIQPAFWGAANPVTIGFNNSNTIASMTCSGDCSGGESFTLDLTSAVPLTFYDLGNTSPLPYQLHIEGTITSVPLPAAVWLFGFGLMGLLCAVRGKRK